MHSPGHVGIGLTLYAPVGYVLASLTPPALVFVGMGMVLVTAILPDVDEQLPIAHRGPTHSIGFVGAVTLGAAGWGILVSPLLDASWSLSGGVLAVASLLGAGSHLAIDGITPMGIRPFWPVTSRRYTLDLVASNHRRLNFGLLLLGIVATLPVLVTVNP